VEIQVKKLEMEQRLLEQSARIEKRAKKLDKVKLEL
jgi:hypothetical protein